MRRYETPSRGAVAEVLFRRGWVPAEPRAAVVLVHGFAEHSGRYEHVGRWLAGRGVATHAYDHLGHGLSSGPRCHVRRFDDYLDDLAHVLEAVRGEHRGLPLFLVGHSMGGLVSARFAILRQPELTGVALSGPALGLAPGTSRWRLGLAMALRRVAPRLRVSAGLDVEGGLCSDPAVVEAYLADPLVERKATLALMAELLGAVDEVEGAGARFSLPLLILHGDDDTLCSADTSERFAAAAPQGRIVRYPGLRHEIFNEPSHEEVLAELFAWLEEQRTRPQERPS